MPPQSFGYLTGKEFLKHEWNRRKIRFNIPNLTMKRNESPIVELNMDALHYVMVCLDKSGDGFAYLARVTSVCKEFKGLVAEKEVLGTLVSEKSFVYDRDESIWNLDGLLTKCHGKIDMNFRKTILDLGNDVLMAILLLVAASAGGATDVANMIASCQVFAMWSDDKNLLKMVNFEELELEDSVENWLHIRGLLIRCAEAGNASAQCLLAKVILKAYSQLLDKESDYNKRLRAPSEASSSRAVEPEPDILPAFLSYFRPGQAIDNDSNTRKYTHFELVSLFLRQCNIVDHAYMLPYVHYYVEHFSLGLNNCAKFFWYYNHMTAILRAIVDVGREKRRRYSPRFGNNGLIKPDLRNARVVMLSLSKRLGCLLKKVRVVNQRRGMHLSYRKWEELKSECRYIGRELLSSVCVKPLEGELKISDMGKRFFYYLAFSGPVTREIEVPTHINVTNLQAQSIRYAINYINLQLQAASTFNELFQLPSMLD